MDDLIEALQIFRKYQNPNLPTHCEHDVLYIAAITAEEVSEEDTKRLYELGFFYGEDYGEGTESFMSYKFGRV